MSIRRSFAITAGVEGPLGAVLRAEMPKDTPTLEEVLTTLAELAFVVETIAHLQGKEKELLPTADKARRQIVALQPTVMTGEVK